MDHSSETAPGGATLASFRLPRGWAVIVAIFVVAAFIGVNGVFEARAERDSLGLVFIAVWTVGLIVAGYWRLFRDPHRIDVTNEGVRFVAASRSPYARWSDLQSVSSPWYVNRQALRWSWADGHVLTWGPYGESLDQLLRLVKREAPDADLEAAMLKRPLGSRYLRRRS